MHNQKTIAKWMAIILLATLVVGCYILFTTLDDKSSAQGSESANAGNTEPEPEPHVPVYSVLPRTAENADGISVAHTGGEKDDIFDGMLALDNKRYVFFHTESEEYDLKSKGLCLALFEDSTLISVTRIAGPEETYVGCKLAKNGIILLTRSKNDSVLRLLNSDCSVAAYNEFPPFYDYCLYLSGNRLWMLTSDGEYVYAYNVLPTVKIEKSTFQYAADDAKIQNCFALSANSLFLVLSVNANDTEFVEFDENLGFSCKKRMIGAPLLQVTPDSQKGNLVFYALFRYNGGILLNLFDSAINVAASTFIDKTDSACMAVGLTEIKLVTMGKTRVYCKHLDLLSTFENGVSAEEIKETNPEIVFYAVNAVTNDGNFIFYVRMGDRIEVYELSNHRTDKILTAASVVSDCRILIYEGKTEAVFSTSSHEKFAYMSFGGSDVFYISTDTSRSA